jgi:hypothetical protein
MHAEYDNLLLYPMVIAFSLTKNGASWSLSNRRETGRKEEVDKDE